MAFMGLMKRPGGDEGQHFAMVARAHAPGVCLPRGQAGRGLTRGWARAAWEMVPAPGLPLDPPRRLAILGADLHGPYR